MVKKKQKPTPQQGLVRQNVELFRQELIKSGINKSQLKQSQDIKPIKQERFNPFAHKTTEEVWGEDDGLTIFDSNKINRQQGTTSNFFGFD